MATIPIMIRTGTILYVTTAIYLMAFTPVSTYSQTKTGDDKQRRSHTQSKSYFDDINRISRLSQQKKYFESAKIQSELDKISETMFTLSGAFSKQFQNKKTVNLLGSYAADSGVDIQKIFVSALDAVATRNDSYCFNDSYHLLTSIVERQSWAIQFLDAFGKPGPGLTLGRLNFVGDYAQCRAAVGSSNNGTRTFRGNYCVLKANIGPPTPLGQLVAQLGTCMPDTCSEVQSTLFVTEVIQLLGLNGTLEADTTECHTDKREMTTATEVSIILVVVIGLMMIFGTSFDIIFIQWPKWYTNSTEDSFMTNGLISKHQGYSAIGEEDQELKNEITPLISNVKSDQDGVCVKVLLAFSVYTNGSKVLDTRQPPGSLGAIHGIRFLSMSWVLLGHIFVFGLSQVSNLASEFPVLLKRWTFDAIANAFVSVDTFFTLSGLLTAYLTLTEIKKKGWKINWPLFYFHRFWRLTPPYMLTILIVLGFQQYLGSGALWETVQPQDKENCEKYWWANLLYVNNLVESDKMCFGHSWYMANDMQFFILSPLMIVPFYFHYSLGVASCVGFLLICFISTGVLSTKNEWPASLMQGGGEEMNLGSWFQDYYIKPWCRIGAYAVGVLAGSYLAINNGKIKMKWYAVWIGWITAIGAGLAIVYGLRGDIGGENTSSVELMSFYNAVSRSAWAACICWVIIACASGYGGFVNSLLSWSPFVVLGRLTYMAYLIHPCLMYVYFQNREQLYFITDTNIAVTFCGIVVLTNIVAFVLMLAFESPWIGLERTFLRKKNKE